MPRPGPTPPEPAKKRRNHSAAQAARIKRWRRRALLLIVFGGAVAWLFLSGVPQRVASALHGAADRATASRGLVIRKLLVQGRVNIDPATLRAVLQVQPGDPLFSFAPRAAQMALLQIPWVQTAQVERRLPDTIYVRLTERAPFALWQNQGKLRLIDRDGVVLTDENLQKFSALPMVAGDDAPAHAGELLDLIRAEPTLLAQLDAANWVSDRRWDLLLKGGVTVQLPSTDVGMALHSLTTAQTDGKVQDKNITVIDLREPGRMTVRKKAGEAGN